MTEIFSQIAALLLLATVVAAVGLRLKQLLIVSFIVVGILAGPSVLGWVAAKDEVDLLARLGIALLLFVVGLKLDPQVIRTMGKVALATGLGQVVFTSVVGFFLSLALGLSVVASIYVAVALTFSSTIIVVKLLSDKGEVDELHGRIAIGFLIVQDIVVVLVMIGLTAFSQSQDVAGVGIEAIKVILKGGLFLGVIALLMRYVLTPLLHWLARSSEMLVLFSIAWAAGLGAAGAELGFSKEVGAFLAGVSLAATPYREVIGSRLVSLRDFLLLFFFIDLGAQLDLGAVGDQILPAIILSGFVLVGNPLIVMIIMGLMGYRKRTGFLAGLTVSQISEFSLILGALGVRLGHLDAGTMGIITLVGLITISISSYMILYSQSLYERFSPWMRIFEKKMPNHSEEAPSDGSGHGRPEFIVFGLGRFGKKIARELLRRGRTVVGIDIDPDLTRVGSHDGCLISYGDADDPEFLGQLPLASLKCVISTIRQTDVNITLATTLRQRQYEGRIAATADTHRNSGRLAAVGVDTILTPYKDAALEAVEQILQDASQPSEEQ